MVKNKVTSLRLPDGLYELIAFASTENRADNATTMRQWLYKVAEDHALRLVEEGRLSASRAAEWLDISLLELFDMAAERGIRLGSTADQYEASRPTLERLAKEYTGVNKR